MELENYGNLMKLVGKEKYFSIRKSIVYAAMKNGIKPTARKFGMSKNTIRLWLRRFKSEGNDGLLDQRNGPLQIPHKTSQELEEAVLRVRKTASCYGARRIKCFFDLTPSVGAIQRILKDHGLTKKKRRKYQKKNDLRAVKAKYMSFERLQMDVKYLTDIPPYWEMMQQLGIPRFQYTIRDVKSGMLFLGYTDGISIEKSIKMLNHVLAKIAPGFPGTVVVQTDNGAEFSGTTRRYENNYFTRTVHSYGAEHRYIPPGMCNANADVESIHDTIEEEFYNLTSFSSREDFLKKAESYRCFYNLQRPNFSKGAKTPWLIAQQDHSDSDFASVVQFTEVIDLDSVSNRIPLGGQTLPVLSAFFPDLEHEAGPIPDTLIELSYILQTIHFQKIPFPERCWTGRPPKSRRSILNAFIAKSFLCMSTTLHLIERLKSDKHLRLICGFNTLKDVPSESVFSRAFTEFAEAALPQQIHEALVKKCYAGKTIGHIARDSTAIEAREKPARKNYVLENSQARKNRRGRPRKGEEPPAKEPTRVQKQLNMSVEEMLKELPLDCDRGSKKNSKGNVENWNGYKFHIDTADNGVPISTILTSASVHDSQVAIPLATITAERVHNFYDLMDAAYHLKEIEEHSRSLNHIPIIDINPRRNEGLKSDLESEKKAWKTLNWKPAEARRYNQRTVAERTNSRLKDEFGGRVVRVRGPNKVFCHLMMGILIIAADQLIRLIN